MSDLTQKYGSEKLQVMDQDSYNSLQIQRQLPSSSFKRIRNAKYKRTRATFNLMNFVRRKHIQPKKLNLKYPSNTIIKKTSVHKKGKKSRENKHKKLSRLKKHILLNRKKTVNNDLNDLVKVFNNLSIEQSVKPKPTNLKKVNHLHSRRFRSYCNNCTSKELEGVTINLLQELNRFQKRAFRENSIKARAHRRFVLGFRETQSVLKIKKVKLVIIAVDCEECDINEGLDSLIKEMTTYCEEHRIPYVFCLRRRKLGYVLHKKVGISCVAILDYDGVRDVFAKLIEMIAPMRSMYSDHVKNEQNSTS